MAAKQTKQASGHTPEEMFAQFVAFMAAQNGTQEEADLAETARTRKASPVRTRKAGRPKGTTVANGAKRPVRAHKPVNAPIACITAGTAWQALGANPDFEPRDKDKPANNGQLWALNAAGRLSLAS